MNLTMDKTPVFSAVNPAGNMYPYLNKNIECDVAIIGGGIAGALCAHRFAKAGVNCVLLSADPLCQGSSSASLGLLFYGAGKSFKELNDTFGFENAIMLYDACLHAIDEIEQLSKALGDPFSYERKDFLTLSASASNIKLFETENFLRQNAGFDTQLIEYNSSDDEWSFDVTAGLLAKNLCAQVDPYRLVHALVDDAVSTGLQVYENTVVESITHDTAFSLKTTQHKTVNANWVLMATGNDASQFLGNVTTVRTVFNVATNPLDSFKGYEDKIILHHYDHDVYIRTTHDNRIVIGGLKCAAIDPQSNIAGVFPAPKIAGKRYQELEQIIRTMFFEIPNMHAEYCFASRAVDTRNHLPIIGEHKSYPGFLFTVCPAENGIVYSQIASRMLLDLYNGTKPQELPFFAPQA